MISQKSKAGEGSFMVLPEMKVKKVKRERSMYIFPTCGHFLDLPQTLQSGIYVCLNQRFFFFYIETVLIKEFFSTGSIVRMEINEGRENL